jgi:hypothetical protein
VAGSFSPLGWWISPTSPGCFLGNPVAGKVSPFALSLMPRVARSRTGNIFSVLLLPDLCNGYSDSLTGLIIHLYLFLCLLSVSVSNATSVSTLKSVSVSSRGQTWAGNVAQVVERPWVQSPEPGESPRTLPCLFCLWQLSGLLGSGPHCSTFCPCPRVASPSSVCVSPLCFSCGHLSDAPGHSHLKIPTLHRKDLFQI